MSYYGPFIIQLAQTTGQDVYLGTDGLRCGGNVQGQIAGISNLDSAPVAWKVMTVRPEPLRFMIYTHSTVATQGDTGYVGAQLAYAYSMTGGNTVDTWFRSSDNKPMMTATVPNTTSSDFPKFNWNFFPVGGGLFTINNNQGGYLNANSDGSTSFGTAATSKWKLVSSPYTTSLPLACCQSPGSSPPSACTSWSIQGNGPAPRTPSSPTPAPRAPGPSPSPASRAAGAPTTARTPGSPSPSQDQIDWTFWGIVGGAMLLIMCLFCALLVFVGMK